MGINKKKKKQQQKAATDMSRHTILFFSTYKHNFIIPGAQYKLLTWSLTRTPHVYPKSNDKV